LDQKKKKSSRGKFWKKSLFETTRHDKRRRCRGGKVSTGLGKGKWKFESESEQKGGQRSLTQATLALLIAQEQRVV